MAMSKRDESNKEKTTSSYNLPSTTPIPPSATATISQPASTTNTLANAYQPIPLPNEEPRATSHPHSIDPRSTNQGSKNDAQAVADLLAFATDASTHSPPSHEEPQRPFSLKRPASEPQSPPDAGNKKMKLMPPIASLKKPPPRSSGESYQFVQYSPKLPHQPTKRKDAFPDEPTHSTPSPGTTVSHVTRASTSPTAMTTPPHMRPALYTQISTIAPGPFLTTAAPQLYAPYLPSPTGLPQVPTSTNIAPPSTMIMAPWPAMGSTTYQIPPTLPVQQQYYGPPLSLEQLMKQRLQHINYASGIEYHLLKRCLPDQPLNFFKTDVVPPHAPVMPAPHNMLRPFIEPTGEATAIIIEPLPHLPQLIQTLEVPLEAPGNTATQADTNRGPPKKLPLHLVQ